MSIFGKIFGPDSVRWITKSAYEAQYKALFKKMPSISPDEAHGEALIYAMNSRYIALRRHLNVFDLTAEVMPFSMIGGESSVGLLAEYLIYQEHPKDADVGVLRSALSSVVINATRDPEKLEMIVGMFMMKPRWVSLLDQRTLDRLTNEIETRLRT